MQKRSLVLLSVGTLLVAGIIFALAFTNRNSAQGATVCTTTGHSHMVVINNDAVSPVYVDAHICDTLTIINKDSKTREIGFGEHDHHKAYDGVSEKVLSETQSMTLTLNEVGEYHFHDHFQEEVAGSFTVIR